MSLWAARPCGPAVMVEEMAVMVEETAVMVEETAVMVEETGRRWAQARHRRHLVLSLSATRRRVVDGQSRTNLACQCSARRACWYVMGL